MKKMPLIIGIAVVIVAAVIGAAVLMLGGSDSNDDGTIAVPINTQGADDVGALHIELAYDPAILQVADVAEGILGENAMMETNLDTPGWVVISMIDSNGMSGDGSLAVVNFEVLATDGATCPLNLENLKAWDSTDVFRIPAGSYQGSYAVEDSVLTAPVFVFNP